MILYTCALSLILYFLMNEWEGKTVNGNIALTLLVCHKLCHKLCDGASKRSAFVTGTSALAMGTSALSLMMQDSWSPIHSLPHNFAEIFMAIYSCPHIIAGTFMAIVVLNQLRWISVSALGQFHPQPHQAELVGWLTSSGAGFDLRVMCPSEVLA